MERDEILREAERKRAEFNKLAQELRGALYPDEDELRPGEKELLDPKQCAVIVIDMHGAYCDPNEVLPTLMGSTTNQIQGLVPKLEAFLGKARESGVKIVWTKMRENPDDMSDNYKAKWKIDDTPPLSVPGTKGYEYSGLSPQEGDSEIDKITYNAFKDTKLDEMLTTEGRKTIILVGGYTSRCVQATATVGADMLGYNVFMCREFVGVPDTITAEELTTFSLMHDIYGFMKTPKVITEVRDSYSEDVTP